MPQQRLPSELGYFMPAEFARHEATWLTWPKLNAAWQGEQFKAVEEVYVRMLDALLGGEKVHLLIRDAAERRKVIQAVGRHPGFRNLIFHETQAGDIWIRDYGPTFVIHPSGKKAACKWRFNAWGNKYPELVADDAIFRRPDLIDPQNCFQADFVLEGGAIDVNGTGLCLSSKSCLFTASRNPLLSEKALEERIKNYLGVSEILLLEEGLLGDDTDGHVDNLARFVTPEVILACHTKDETHPNARALSKNWAALECYKEQIGVSLHLEPLPVPGPIVSRKTYLPASYANFYIANETVLLPAYGSNQDKEAKAILKNYFPKKDIVAIPSRELIEGLGGIHCATQQEPAV